MSGACPFTVDRPVMRNRWERLTFLHWSFEPAVVQRLLPGRLRVDTFEGRAWVGLVPFFMRVSTPRGRAVPWASNFCETNVRTYVRDSEGRTGVWFFSLDASRAGAVIFARTAYRVPYFWSQMRLVEADGTVSYACRRRLPGTRRVASEARIGIGAPFAASELDERDHFLTARWVLFSAGGGRARFARAWHQPWPLRRARVIALNDGLVEAAGLPTPPGEPLAHYSDGVDVLIGRPERAGAAPGGHGAGP